MQIKIQCDEDIRYMVMRFSFLFSFLLLTYFSHAQQSNTFKIPILNQDSLAPQSNITAAPLHPKDPQSDGSYERFMDSLISRKDIVFSKKTIDAAEDYYFDKEEGPTQHMPPAIIIDGVKFLKSNMQIVNCDERLRDVRIEVDTAMLFTYNGKKYGYINAGYYNCNGTGCMESYHFIADFTTKKLFVFDMWSEPSNRTSYFGDVNNDGQLDFVVPEYVTAGESHLPYSDTTEEIALIPYTLNKAGKFAQIKNDNRQDCFIIGQFDGGNFAPQRFRVIAERWFY